MENKYVEKFKTEHFSIGSFDFYQDLSKELIKKDSLINDEEVDNIMKGMPTTYRASILKKGKYIGFIGLFDIDASNQKCSIRMELNIDLSNEEKDEILDEYKDWMDKSLNLNKIEKSIIIERSKKSVNRDVVEPKANIILPSILLEPNIILEVLERFSKDYQIPKLQMPFTIKSGDRVLGIIGLSNLIWSNKRANLNIFLDKDLGDAVTREFSGYIIDDYLNYIHNLNVHNVSLSVNGSNTDLLKVIKKSSLNYYGFIPFGVSNGNMVESNMLFQHIPNMKKDNEIFIPDNISKDISEFDTDKKEVSPIIDLGDGIKLVSPKVFEKEGIDADKMIDGQIASLQNRDKYAKPLGDDKYIIQKGNGNYGISKAIMNYTYVVVDENYNYIGFVSISKNNANNKNAEAEIGLNPNMHNRGLGKKILNRFCEELFSVGYASVTGCVFDFNTPSLKMSERVTSLNGIRLESYYVNGKLWNMNIFSRVNEGRSIR